MNEILTMRVTLDQKNSSCVRFHGAYYILNGLIRNTERIRRFAINEFYFIINIGIGSI